MFNAKECALPVGSACGRDARAPRGEGNLGTVVTTMTNAEATSILCDVQSRVSELFLTEPAVPSAVPTGTCGRSNPPV